MNIEVYTDSNNLIHMSRFVWTKEKLIKVALLCKTRSEFHKRFQSGYNAAIKIDILDEICTHMPIRVDVSASNNPNFKYTHRIIKDFAVKCKTRGEFAIKFPSVYNAAKKQGLDKFCKHMPEHVNQSGSNNPNFKYTDLDLEKEALKYKTSSEFKEKNPKMHRAASRRKILKIICSHMKLHRGYSRAENALFEYIKSYFSSAKKYRDSKVKIPNKPYIKAFEIDIFVQELNKGIEFDGLYYHSFNRMRNDKRKKNWSDSDIANYHKIKDDYFSSLGINILHIKEEDWLKNKEKCFKECLDFLNIDIHKQ